MTKLTIKHTGKGFLVCSRLKGYENIFIPSYLILFLGVCLFSGLTFKKLGTAKETIFAPFTDSKNTDVSNFAILKKMDSLATVELLSNKEYQIKMVLDAVKSDSTITEKTCVSLYNDYKITCDYADIFMTVWLKSKMDLVKAGVPTEIIEKYGIKSIEVIEVEHIKPILTVPKLDNTEVLVFNSYTEKEANEYIKKYLPAARKEFKKSGVPIYVTLSQGLLESCAGKSRLATENNNHFGIKCFSNNCKKGHCVNYTDDTHKDFFIRFNSVLDCYEYHSTFLHKERYKHLFKLQKTDYKGWCIGLKKAGYATDKDYANSLILIIEKYGLNKY